eukprot:2869188-Prymnesium_polylepis.1
MSDAVDGRSAARCRNTIVRESDTFLHISPSLGCGTSHCSIRSLPGSGFPPFRVPAGSNLTS